jgi:hypothetical protein
MSRIDGRQWRYFMKTLIVLMIMALITCPGRTLASDAEKGVRANEATTVKSGKSNSSDRVGTTGEQSGDQNAGQTQPATGEGQQAPKVKGSKSNSSE